MRKLQDQKNLGQRTTKRTPEAIYLDWANNCLTIEELPEKELLKLISKRFKYRA